MVRAGATGAELPQDLDDRSFKFFNKILDAVVDRAHAEDDMPTAAAAASLGGALMQEFEAQVALAAERFAAEGAALGVKSEQPSPVKDESTADVKSEPVTAPKTEADEEEAKAAPGSELDAPLHRDGADGAAAAQCPSRDSGQADQACNAEAAAAAGGAELSSLPPQVDAAAAELDGEAAAERAGEEEPPDRARGAGSDAEPAAGDTAAEQDGDASAMDAEEAAPADSDAKPAGAHARSNGVACAERSSSGPRNGEHTAQLESRMAESDDEATLPSCPEPATAEPVTVQPAADAESDDEAVLAPDPAAVKAEPAAPSDADTCARGGQTTATPAGCDDALAHGAGAKGHAGYRGTQDGGGDEDDAAAALDAHELMHAGDDAPGSAFRRAVFWHWNNLEYGCSADLDWVRFCSLGQPCAPRLMLICSVVACAAGTCVR